MPKRYYLIFLFTAIGDVFVFLTVLAVWAMWGTKLHWNQGLWCELKPDSWPCRSWYRVKIEGKYYERPEDQWETRGKWITWGGTTLGHGGFYGPGISGAEGTDTPTEFHELIHVEQFEVVMVLVSFIAILVGVVGTVAPGALSAWVLAGVIMVLGFFLKAAAGWLVAALRGEDAYRGSTHEESAYAQTELKYERT